MKLDFWVGLINNLITVYKGVQIPLSFFVQYSELPYLCNIGRKHTPYRYSGLRPPASSTGCSWAFCRNISNGTLPHYSSKLLQSANHVPDN